jgi:translation initiation factor 2D
MFKKKPQIKNLSPLRSSDRRKLADQIISDYGVSIPTPTEAGSDEPSGPTLTSIRSSLLPENCLSARFTTHAGPNAVLVSGTVYVGAHSGQEERVLWLQYGKEARLYPTVYTLWQNAGLVPLLHTPDFVVEKLRTGADLMTPGLVGGPPWPEKAKEGAVVAVAGLGRDSVPVWVGTCIIDVAGLGRVQGMKGVAVEGIHWAGDEIYNWSQMGSGGREVPDAVAGWQSVAARLTDDVNDLDIDEDEEGQQEDGGVSLSQTPAENGHAADADEDDDREPEREPTTSEIDDAFHEAFLYSVHKAKASGAPAPKYGIDFPIQATFLMQNMVQPNLRYQSPHYNIKKTSWKNTKKFIKQLDKEVLVKSKDRNGGETVILDIDFDDPKVKDFTPYRLPKPKATAIDSTSTSNSGTGPQLLQLVTMYKPSPKLSPDLIPLPGTFYTAPQIQSFLKTYIASDAALTTGTSSPRHLKLNPFLANTVVPSNKSSEITRDALVRHLFDTPNLLAPYYLMLTTSSAIEAWSPADPSAVLKTHKPKAYPPPSILIILEKRTGSKTVTRISGLEAFNLNPNTFGPELQKKAAGSASVAQLVGGKPGMLEITVQGDQRDVVKQEMFKRGVKTEWVKVEDKVNKKKSGR